MSKAKSTVAGKGQPSKAAPKAQQCARRPVSPGHKTQRHADVQLALAVQQLQNMGVSLAPYQSNGQGVDAQPCFLPLLLLFGLFGGARGLGRGFGRGMGGMSGFGGPGMGGFGGPGIGGFGGPGMGGPGMGSGPGWWGNPGGSWFGGPGGGQGYGPGYGAGMGGGLGRWPLMF